MGDGGGWFELGAAETAEEQTVGGGARTRVRPAPLRPPLGHRSGVPYQSTSHDRRIAEISAIKRRSLGTRDVAATRGQEGRGERDARVMQVTGEDVRIQTTKRYRHRLTNTEFD